MKKLTAIFLAALLLLSLAACRTETETVYLQSSTTQEYIGIMTFRTETEYDSQGRQITFTQYTNGEETSRVEYTYADNTIIGLTTQGDQTSTMKQVYEKDAAGNITHLEMYVDDVLYSVTEQTYDENGNCLTSVQNSITVERTYTTTYTYDDQGNRLTVTHDTGDGIGQRQENTYVENGRLVTTVITDLQGNITSREEHTWTTDVSELVEIYDPEGNLTSTRAVTYDEHGNMLTSETYDAAGELTARITYTYVKIEVPVK